MYCFLQWNIQQTKYTLAVKCKLAKLTSDPWETLDDFGNLYKGSLNKPYVSWRLHHVIKIWDQKEEGENWEMEGRVGTCEMKVQYL